MTDPRPPLSPDLFAATYRFSSGGKIKIICGIVIPLILAVFGRAHMIKRHLYGYGSLR